MSEHTPGPWRVAGTYDAEVRSDEYGTIADTYWEVGGPVPPATARLNARLIAAAPDLLAACEAVAASWGTGHPEHIVHAHALAIRAALKAKGEPS